MKLVCLNIWGGRIYKPLMQFLGIWSRRVDVFCFQEVLDNPPNRKSKVQLGAQQDINQAIQKALGDFTGWMSPKEDYEESVAMYIRKSTKILEKGERFVYRWKNAMIGKDTSTSGINLQYTTIQHREKIYTILNIHGHWEKDYKGDNDARIEQSMNIQKVLMSIGGPKILCGDFNLAPDTKSMQILECCMRNLVKEYGITSTRSTFHTRGVKFADYILVSSEVHVREFKVLAENISDHQPILIDFV